MLLNDTTTFQPAKNQCEIAKYWKSLLFKPSKILKKKTPRTRIMDGISVRVHVHVLCIFLLLLKLLCFYINDQYNTSFCLLSAITRAWFLVIEELVLLTCREIQSSNVNSGFTIIQRLTKIH